MTARNYSNTASVAELAVLINSTDTSVTLSSYSGYPSAPFIGSIDPDTVDEEVVLVTGVAGSTLTITRAYDGSTAKSHSAGAKFRHVAAAIDFREANVHIAATAGAHGVAGTLVGTTDAQTLTNKTLTSPTISAPTVTGLLSGASGTFSGALSGGSLSTGGNATVSGTLGVTGATTLSTVTATSGTIATLNATTIAASGAVTVGGTLGVTGTLSGANATLSGQLTAATVDADLVVPDEIEFTQLAADSTAAVGRSSLWARTDFGLYFLPNGQTRRRVQMHWGSGATLPTTGAISGDTFVHTGLANSMLRYNGTNWRQLDGPIQVANEAALPTHADLHAGFTAWSLADDRAFEYTGAAWVRQGEQTGTLTAAAGFGSFSGYYAPGWRVQRGRVTLRGMLLRTGTTVSVPVGGTVAIATVPAAIAPTSAVSPLSWFQVGIPSTETYPCRLYLPSPYTTLYVAGMSSGSGSLAQNTGLVNLDGCGWFI